MRAHILRARREEARAAPLLAAARRRRANLTGEWARACIVFNASKVGKRLGTTYEERAQRNLLIIALCENHRVADVARMTGFTRARIYQILGGYS